MRTRTDGNRRILEVVEKIDRLEREKGEQAKKLRQIEAEHEKSRNAMANQLALEAAKAARHETWVRTRQVAEEARLTSCRLEQQARDNFAVSLLQRKRVDSDLDFYRMAFYAVLTRIRCDGIHEGTSMISARVAAVWYSPFGA